jgi:DNA-binding MurR/RpiR family transcriptional regulator
MYREKIREYYEHLSRSYRKVADFIMSNYYEVSFMTAAQLAYSVGVDTTTVVRFSQRLGFNGYPELLHDIREQVKAEIYAAYEPKELSPSDPAGVFTDRAKQEQHNLSEMLVHNPPEHIRRVAALFDEASHVVFCAEGYSGEAALLAAEQLRHRGISAEAAADDPVRLAGTLVSLKPGTLVVGISATEYGEAVASALAYARDRGCATLGVVGSLASPVNRMSDEVVYAPTDVAGPLPSIVAIVAALSALIQVAARDTDATSDLYVEEFLAAYDYLTKHDAEAEVPEAMNASE